MVASAAFHLLIYVKQSDTYDMLNFLEYRWVNNTVIEDFTPNIKRILRKSTLGHYAIENFPPREEA